MSDFYKMWHYKMEIKDKCEDSKVSVAGGLLFSLKYPSNTYYTPALCVLRSSLEAPASVMGTHDHP